MTQCFNPILLTLSHIQQNLQVTTLKRSTKNMKNLYKCRHNYRKHCGKRRKGEIAQKKLLLLSYFFQKLSAVEASEIVYMRGRVNICCICFAMLERLNGRLFTSNHKLSFYRIYFMANKKANQILAWFKLSTLSQLQTNLQQMTFENINEQFCLLPQCFKFY